MVEGRPSAHLEQYIRDIKKENIYESKDTVEGVEAQIKEIDGLFAGTTDEAEIKRLEKRRLELAEKREMLYASAETNKDVEIEEMRLKEEERALDLRAANAAEESIDDRIEEARQMAKAA